MRGWPVPGCPFAFVDQAVPTWSTPLRSERRRLFNALNEGTERENSECPLITLKLLADFDSAIRRFDPSRPSQPFRPLLTDA